ncbi:hypothetical protein LRS40_14945 [Leclercia sp. G3L]|uniref:hypothetical protein n=1 Tax=Leclercia sp. G3L TaxID=2898725 RepID=UPI001E5F4B08|nr:hypothetical protein [Leclercia sp. G3L]UGB01005.1 hypothetical protein LRS40_14945 [Leclercia sp. G3L]
MRSVNNLAEFIIITCFCMFLFDVTLLGSGAWSINVIGVSIRKIEYAFILLFVLFTLRGVYNFIYVIEALVFSLVFGLAVPMLNGVNLNYSLAELMPFLGVLFCPLIVTNKYILNNWQFLKRCMLSFCLLSAVGHILIWCFGLLHLPYADITKAMLTNALTSGTEDAIDNIIIADTPDGLFRVLLPNSSLLVVGFYLAIQRYLEFKTIKHLLYVVIIFVALYSTWTRALYLSPVIVMLGLFAYKLCPLAIKLKSYLTYYILSLAIVMFIIITGLIIHPKVLSVLGIASVSSDDVRFEQVTWILNTFIENPLFGTGLGGNAQYLRSDIAPWTYEMSLMSLIMKIGIIGCMLFFIIQLTIIPGFFKNFFDGHRLSSNKVLWLLFSFSILVMFSTNPFMLSFPGVTITVFILGELLVINKRKVVF